MDQFNKIMGKAMRQKLGGIMKEVNFETSDLNMMEMGNFNIIKIL
jgi:hypothetical protein